MFQKIFNIYSLHLITMNTLYEIRLLTLLGVAGAIVALIIYVNFLSEARSGSRVANFSAISTTFLFLVFSNSATYTLHPEIAEEAWEFFLEESNLCGEKLGLPRGRSGAVCNQALYTMLIISILCRVYNRITDLSGVNINCSECGTATWMAAANCPTDILCEMSHRTFVSTRFVWDSDCTDIMRDSNKIMLIK